MASDTKKRSSAKRSSAKRSSSRSKTEQLAKDAQADLKTGRALPPVVNPSSLDPALVDGPGTAKARVEGRTSDAATRAADGPHIDEVPADVGVGNKPSDGGPEAYPFPQGGDVDVATVDPGTGKGEFFAPLAVEDVVILGKHELVPDRLVGRRAFILDAPRDAVPMDEKDDVWITVRTRDEANATLNIPLAAVAEIQKGGLSLTHRG